MQSRRLQTRSRMLCSVGLLQPLSVHLRSPCLICVAAATEGYVYPRERTPSPDHNRMAQRTAPPQARYYVDAIEPPSRLPSPWATMTTPSPSPGPPPSPAVWMPHDWTPVARKTAPMRSLPLLPSNSANASAGHETHEMQALRTNTTYSPLPTHPEFLRNLQSHPMIIERAGAESLTRTPSPASSVEFVHQPTPGPFATGKYRAGALVASPVPFPSDVRFASPSPANSGFSSPRRLPDVYGSQQGSQHGSQHSLRSMSSSRPSPSASPESAAALSSPRRNPVAMPRARVPAIGASAMASAALEQPRAPDCPRHPVFYMQEGMVVLKVSAFEHRGMSRLSHGLIKGPGVAVQDPQVLA